MTAPQAPPNPFAQFGNDPCGALPLLRAALYSLLAGQGVAEVAFENQVLRFQRSSLPELRAEIQTLEARCQHGPRAMRAGPYSRRPNSFPFGHGSWGL